MPQSHGSSPPSRSNGRKNRKDPKTAGLPKGGEGFLSTREIVRMRTALSVSLLCAVVGIQALARPASEAWLQPPTAVSRDAPFAPLPARSAPLAADLPSAIHELQFVAEWGTGEYRDVFVQGSYAYCAADRAGLDVVDITDPAAPTLVANTPTAYDAEGVFASGSYAFVSAYRQNVGSGLLVFDISNPLAPSQIGVLDPLPAGDYDGAVFVAGSHAYLGYSGGGFDIVDVSDPAAPSRLSGFRGVSDVRDIFVLGNYAYLAAYDNGLWIVDVSDPGAPSLEGIFTTSGWLESVWVQGSYAYLAAWHYGLLVVDVADPSAPTQEGRADWGPSLDEVFVFGSYAYAGGGGLHIIDVSTPSAPSLVGSETDQVGYFQGSIVDTKVYLGDRQWATFQVFEVSDPAAPLRLGSLQCPERVSDVAVSGDHAYLGTEHGLAVLDISDRSSPGLLAFYPGDAIRYQIGNVVVRGDYAYLTVYSSLYESCGVMSVLCLEIVDVSDPSSPTQVGVYELDDGAHDLYLQGDYAYLALDTYGSPVNDGFLVIDISNPALPWLAGSYGPEWDAWSVEVQGEHAFVDLEGLRVLDVDPPWDITEVTFVGGYGNLAVEGSFLFRCKWWPQGSEQFEVFDISDPTSPNLEGSLPFWCWRPSGMAVDRGYAYVTSRHLDSYHHALQILDVSDASTPVPVGTYPTFGEAYEVRVDGDHVFLADGYTGKLLIYRIVSADLAVTKTDSQDPVPPGGDLSYTLTVGNGGWTNATGVVLTDTLPADVTFVASTPGEPVCTESAGSVTCGLGGLAVGGAAQVTIEVEVNTGASGTLSNSATVVADQIDWLPADNSAVEDTIIGPPECDLEVTKTDSQDPVPPGENFSYTVTVANLGPSIASGVQMIDTLPPEVAFVAVTPGAPTCTESAGVVTCDLDSLDPADTTAISIEVATEPAFTGFVTNNASVSGNETDPNGANNSAFEQTRLAPLEVFADGFESGDTSAWSGSVP